MAETGHRPALARDFPAAYAMIYPVVAEVGREHGYAVAIHGSLARDLDLLAVPWTETASAPADLIAAICLRVRNMEPDVCGAVGPEEKPHGRLAWALPLRIGAFLDVSVMPIRPPVASAVELVAERLHNEWCEGMKQVPDWQKVKDAIGGETVWHDQARDLLSALARVDPDTCAVLRAAWSLFNSTEPRKVPGSNDYYVGERVWRKLADALTDWECEHGDIHGPHGWNLPAKDDEGAEPDSWSFDPPDRVEGANG